MPHPPGPFDIFPPKDVHHWLTDLQRRIKQGINPPDSPGPSRSPSPLLNGHLDPFGSTQDDAIDQQGQYNGIEAESESESDGSGEEEEELDDINHQPQNTLAATNYVEVSSDDEDEDELQDDEGQFDEEGDYYEDDREANVAYDEQDELYDDDPRYGVVPEEDHQAYVGSDGDVYADQYGTGESEDEEEDEEEEEEDGQENEPSEEGNESDESDGIEYVGQSQSPLPTPSPILNPLDSPPQAAPVPSAAASTSIYPGTGIYFAPASALPALSDLTHAPSPYADPGAPISTSTPDPTFSAQAPLPPSVDTQVYESEMDIDPTLLNSGYQIDTAFLNDLVQHVAQGGAPLSGMGQPGPSFGSFDPAQSQEVDGMPSMPSLDQPGESEEDFEMGDEYLDNGEILEEDEVAGDQDVSGRHPSEPLKQNEDMEEADQEAAEQGSFLSGDARANDEEGEEEPVTVKTTTVREVIDIDSSSDDGEEEEDEAEQDDQAEDDEEDEDEDEDEEEEEEEEDGEGRISAAHAAFLQDDSIEEEEELEEEEWGRADGEDEEGSIGDEQPEDEPLVARDLTVDTDQVVEDVLGAGEEVIESVESRNEVIFARSATPVESAPAESEVHEGVDEDLVEMSAESAHEAKDLSDEGARTEHNQEAIEIQETEISQASPVDQQPEILPDSEAISVARDQTPASNGSPSTPPDPARSPPPTSLLAPLPPHSLQPHPPRSPSVEAQIANDPRPSEVPEPPLSKDQSEREETPVEFPDPKSAPPDSDFTAEFAYNPDPHPPSSPSLIVEPPADPRPDITFSRTVSRAATPSIGAAFSNGDGAVPGTPVEFPDPRLPPADAHLDVPLTPHGLEPNDEGEQSPSLRVQVGASRKGSLSGPSSPPSESQEPEVSGDSRIEAHSDPEASKPSEPDEHSPRQSPTYAAAEIEAEDAPPLPLEDDIPMAPMDDYDVQGSILDEQEEDAGLGQELEPHVAADVVQDVEAPGIEGTNDKFEQVAADLPLVTAELGEGDQRAAEESIEEGPEQVADENVDTGGEKPYASAYKGKGRALEIEPQDEERVLDERLPSDPASATASPERPPLATSDSAVERLRHHHGLGSFSHKRIPTQAGEVSKNSLKSHRGRDEGSPSPPAPPVTRSHCYYEKLRLTYEGAVAVILAPHCSLSNTQEIEHEECTVEGVPSEGEEQQARLGQLSHDNEVLQPAFSTKLRRIVGAQLFDEGCCYLLLADDSAKLPPPPSEAKVSTPQSSYARGGPKSRTSLTTSQVSPSKPAMGNPLAARSSKRLSASLEPSTPSRKRLSQEPEPSQGSLAGSVTDVGEDSATDSPEADPTPRRSTRLSLKREAKQAPPVREKRGGSSLRNLLATEESTAQNGQDTEGPTGLNERENTVQSEAVVRQGKRPVLIDLRSVSPDSVQSSGSPTASTHSLQGADMSSSRALVGKKRQRDDDAYRPDEESGDEGHAENSDEENEDEDRQDSPASLEKGTKRKLDTGDGDVWEGGIDDEEHGERAAKRRALENIEESGTPVVEAPKAEGQEQDVGNETQRRHGFGKWFRWW
ncbi:hypothetical protein B9479_004012 [Cryptococcus floricola]|uniref:Uncharacterized protein n=1 Tax=Cryptococcus floricola TaxID=2591691 RepID=A0A5D3AYG5_9TREE|nr:hypothetical protein B9479_004012 [Cryptococcus floricola]